MTKKQIIQLWCIWDALVGVEFRSGQIGRKKNRPHIVGQPLITLYIIADIFELTRDSSNMHKMIGLKYLHTYNSFSILTNKMY